MSYRLFFLFLLGMCFLPIKGLIWTNSVTFQCTQPRLSPFETLNCSGQGRPLFGAYGWFFEPKIDLNKAQWADFILINGIGRKLAKQIAATRTRWGRIDSWSDVLRIHGVGPKMMQRLKSAFYIEAAN